MVIIVNSLDLEEKKKSKHFISNIFFMLNFKLKTCDNIKKIVDELSY